MSESTKLVPRPPSGVAADLFAPPSVEARRLVRLLPWLVAPADGRGSLLVRAFRVIVVAPFTQLTFLSFDLQAFLYEVFHTRAPARIGHFTFMAGVNFFAMAALAHFSFGAPPIAHEAVPFAPNGAAAYATLLLGWYFAMAAVTRMWAWWFVMVPVVLALLAGANVFHGLTFELDAAQRTWLAPSPLAYNPWLWMAACAALIALSHAPEPRLPPHVTQSPEWMSVRRYAFGPADSPHPPARIAVRLIRLALQVVWGTLDEWWASPRLMPYGFLLLMFRAGYEPRRSAQLRDWVARAQASGNPAVDYVGIGGGTCLAFEDSPEREAAPSVRAAG